MVESLLMFPFAPSHVSILIIGKIANNPRITLAISPVPSSVSRFSTGFKIASKEATNDWNLPPKDSDLSLSLRACLAMASRQILSEAGEDTGNLNTSSTKYGLFKVFNTKGRCKKPESSSLVHELWIKSSAA